MTTSPLPYDAALRQYLAFRVAGEEYALDLATVREIVRYEPVTRVPRVPPCVRGVVNVRGLVIPVIDLAAGLGLPAAAVTPQSCLVMVDVPLGGERTALMLLVDEVSQVLDVPGEEIGAPPSFGTRVPTDCLTGTTRREDALVLLLDLARLLGEGLLPASAPLPPRETAGA